MSDSDSLESSEQRVGPEDAADQEKFHVFGRQKPVHSALGGGASANVILWRNKPISGALLAGGTVIWLLFEGIGYHLITFICHSLILSLATLFLWSNLSFFVKRSSVNLPEIELPEDFCNKVALSIREICIFGVCIFQKVAYGQDLKKFLYAVSGLWIVSIVGSWFDFLTLIYSTFVMVLTLSPLYEKHEDRVDLYAEKAKSKLKRQYSSLDEKVLRKIPKVVRFMIEDKKKNN